MDLVQPEKNKAYMGALPKKVFGIKAFIYVVIVQKLYVLASVMYGKYNPLLNPQFFSLTRI